MELNNQLDALIDNAEELLLKLADYQTPEVDELRDRIDKAIGEARNAISIKATRTTVELRDLFNTLDDYVHDYPWAAMGAAVAVTATLALFVGMTMGAVQKGTTR